MKYLAALFGIVALLGFSGVATAHTFGPEGQGNPYYAPAIPEEYVPTYDGDISDWAFMPSKWTNTPETAPSKSEEIEKGKVPKDDFDAVVYGPAWIPTMNMWTFAVHKVDEKLYGPPAVEENIKKNYMGDNQQWCTDPDHSGGLYRGEEPNSRNAQQNFYTPLLGGHIGLYGPEKLWWEFEEPYCYFAQTLDKATGSYDMELAINLWDWLEPTKEESTLHEFEPGEIIGGTFLVVDVDSEEEAWGIAWHFADPWKNADAFTDFYIMSVEDTLPEIEKELPVETSTWGAVKATFK